MGLRELRQEAALTQKELAAKAGVSKVTIVNIEAGRTFPFAATVRKLAGALGVDTRTLVRTLRDQQAEDGRDLPHRAHARPRRVK